MNLRIRDDYTGSGQVTLVEDDDLVIWSWAWHIDGEPSLETILLLEAIGRRCGSGWSRERR